jgi:PAS domain-containing protein
MLKIEELDAMIPSFLKESNLLYLCVLDIEGQIYFAGKKFQKLFASDQIKNFEANFTDCLDKDIEFDLHTFLVEVTEKPNQATNIELSHNGQSANWEFISLVNDEGDFSGILGIGHPRQMVVSTVPTDYTFPKDVNPATDIFFQLNSSWQILNVNELAEKFFTKKREMLLGNTIWQIYPDKDIYRYALEFKKAKESKTLRVFEDFSTINGRWYKVYIIPRKSGLDVIFKDISQIQNLSEEIKQLQLTLQSVLENTDENVFLVGKDLKIIGYNSAAEKLVKTNFKRDLKDGDKFTNFLFDGVDEVFLKDVESIMSGNFKSFEMPIILKRLNESRIYAHKFFPLIDTYENVVGFGYACQDINDDTLNRKKLKEQNKVMRDILHNQNTLMRSPLSSILGLLELIDPSKLDDENKKYLSYLRPLAMELDKLIRNNSKKVSSLD